MIHLFMNPRRREEWCRENGIEFMLHVQKQQFNKPLLQNYIHQPEQQYCTQPPNYVGGVAENLRVKDKLYPVCLHQCCQLCFRFIL